MTLATGTRFALRQAQGDLEQSRKVGPYEIQAAIGAGGLAFAHGRVTNALRRGLVRLRREAAPARPRRSSAGIVTERRRAEADLSICP